eukprot:g6157.t1
MALVPPSSMHLESKKQADATDKKGRRLSTIAKDEYKKAKKGKTRDGPDGVFTVGYGAGGIEEMEKYLPSSDDMVLFGLLDFKVGSGTFSRHKLIRMHFNGEKCKNVLKGRINSERKKVERVIGHINGDFQICHAEECHTDTVLEKVAHYFAADHSPGEDPLTLKELQLEYERQIKQDQAKNARNMKRKTARDFDRKWKNSEILNYVHHPSGPFNWALFKPNKKSMRTAEINSAKLSKIAKFVNAGSLSVNEMLSDIKDDEVLGGILRMGFGSGTFRRTKHIAIWWSGEKVKAVARGAYNAKKKRMMELLKPWSFTYTAQHKEDLTVKHLIDIVHKKLVVDGATADGEDLFSEDAFYEALGEDINASADFFGDDDDDMIAKKLTPKQAVRKLKKYEGINWVLLGLKK